MFFVSHGGGMLTKDEFNDVIKKAENDMRDDMSKMGSGCSRSRLCVPTIHTNEWGLWWVRYVVALFGGVFAFVTAQPRQQIEFEGKSHWGEIPSPETRGR